MKTDKLASLAWDACSFGTAKNDRERVLLAEIERLRRERDEAHESAMFYLAEFKRTYRDYLDLKELPDGMPDDGGVGYGTF